MNFGELEGESNSDSGIHGFISNNDKKNNKKNKPSMDPLNQDEVNRLTGNNTISMELNTNDTILPVVRDATTIANTPIMTKSNKRQKHATETPPGGNKRSRSPRGSASKPVGHSEVDTDVDSHFTIGKDGISRRTSPRRIKK